MMSGDPRPEHHQVHDAVPDAGLAHHETVRAQQVQGLADGLLTDSELGARPGLPTAR
jgi:hypothetical protein